MFKRRSFSDILKKNIELIYGYPLYLLSFLMPRNKNKWLIGSHIGFAGNSKYFFIDVVTEHKNKKCFWIASTRQEAAEIKALGLPAYYRWSIKGVFHSLTAGVYIFSFHLIDINFWTSGRALRVNLWHGVGIKNIEFKVTQGSAGKIYDEKNIISRIYFPYIFKRPHIFLSTSPLMTQHFKGCFRITDKECMEGTYPRCDIFQWDKSRLTEFINKYEPKDTKILIDKLKTFNKSYLYMPTWRETRYDFITSAGFNFKELDKVLKEKNEVFLLKLHPSTKLDIENMNGLENILILNNKMDIYPVLPFTDVLITDYSSIYYDYLLMENKQVLLFPFDYNEYITKARDLAFDFDTYTPGKRANNFEELLYYIKNDTPLDFPKKEWITQQFWNGNKDNLLRKIETLTK